MSATVKMTHTAIGAEVRRGTYDIVVDGQRAGSVDMNDTAEIYRSNLGASHPAGPQWPNSSRTQTFEAGRSSSAVKPMIGLNDDIIAPKGFLTRKQVPYQPLRPTLSIRRPRRRSTWMHRDARPPDVGVRVRSQGSGGGRKRLLSGPLVGEGDRDTWPQRQQQAIEVLRVRGEVHRGPGCSVSGRHARDVSPPSAA